MRKIVAILCLFTLVVSFQNCAPQSVPLQSAGEIPEIQNKYSALPADKLVFWDYQKYRYVDVDPDSGVMSAFEEMGGSRGKVYCMSEEKLEEMQKLLLSAEVCEPKVEIDPERVCTMLYVGPYASLKSSGDEIRLGERTSGCDSAVDLCEEKASRFKSFVQTMLEELESHQCQ